MSIVKDIVISINFLFSIPQSILGIPFLRKEAQIRCNLFFLKGNADLYSELANSIISSLSLHRGREGRGIGEQSVIIKTFL